MRKLVLGLALTFILHENAGAQLLKKLQQKAAEAAEKVLDKKIEQQTDKLIGGNTESQSNSGTANSSGNQRVGGTSSNTSGSSNNRIRNTEGGGLVTSPPDVKENLISAETAFKSQNYGASRYAIQQAILGVEMEIGNQLLKTLPEKIADLPKKADEDKVSSSGWGWAGLNIQRMYQSDKQQFTFTIANNTMLSAVNQYLASGAYSQTTTGGEQKWKQIMVAGHKALIEYDEGSGYKVTVPLGQSSLMAFEGVNFKSEQDMIAAVNQFNIDEIKKTLGEK